MGNTFWKLPPIEKIPEAYSAIVENRIKIGDFSAEVLSSDSGKTYRVTWNAEGAYASDDNGSKWQGYSGYPILSVLFLQEKLPLNRNIAELFHGIQWKELNKKYKNKYAEALAEILSSFPPEQQNTVHQELERVYHILGALKLQKKSGSGFEPKQKTEIQTLPLKIPDSTAIPDGNLDAFAAQCEEADAVPFFADDRLETIALKCKGKLYILASENFRKEEFQAFLRRFFSGTTGKITHDVKHMIRILSDRNLPTDGFRFDTALAAYLLSPLDGTYTLDLLAKKYLASEMDGSPAAFCETIARLAEILQNELEKNGMKELHDTVELPLCGVLSDMERTGVRVDPEMLKIFGERLSEELSVLQTRIHELAGEPFNINSPKQLGELLFEKLKLPTGKKTKSGYSTDIEVLESLRGKHPLVNAVIEFRQLAKLKSTYADGLLSVIAADGRIHTTFQMMTTATGRLSSTDPNLQNIPIRSERGAELRNMFVASPGNILVDADYSQIELRILAHIAKDEAMCRAFRSNEDIHTVTASQVFNVPRSEVTQEMRRRAKAVNFGIVYGISRFALAEDLGVSRKEADDYMNRYFTTYSGVRHYMDSIVEQAKKDGFVSTVLGRRRPLPELQSSSYNIRAFGERVALNAPIQGTSADIIKLAMIHVHERLKREHLHAKLILQIHDELMIEAPESERELVKTLLREEMEQVVSLSVPLTVDVSSGLNWGNAN